MMSPCDDAEWMNDDVIHDAQCRDPEEEDGSMTAQWSKSRPIRQNEFKFTSLWRKPRLKGRRYLGGMTELNLERRDSPDQEMPMESESRNLSLQTIVQKPQPKMKVKHRESFDTIGSIHLSDFDEGREYTPSTLKRGGGSAPSPYLSSNDQQNYVAVSTTAAFNHNIFVTPDTAGSDTVRTKDSMPESSPTGTGTVAQHESPEDVFKLIRSNGFMKPPPSSKRTVGRANMIVREPKIKMFSAKAVENQGQEPNDGKENLDDISDDEIRDQGDKMGVSMPYPDGQSPVNNDCINSQRRVEERLTPSKNLDLSISERLEFFQSIGRKSSSPQPSSVATNHRKSGLEESLDRADPSNNVLPDVVRFEGRSGHDQLVAADETDRSFSGQGRIAATESKGAQQSDKSLTPKWDRSSDRFQFSPARSRLKQHPMKYEPSPPLQLEWSTSQKKQGHHDLETRYAISTSEKRRSRAFQEANGIEAIDFCPAGQPGAPTATTDLNVKAGIKGSPASKTYDKTSQKIRNAAPDVNQVTEKGLVCNASSGDGVNHRPFYAWLAQREEKLSDKLLRSPPTRRIQSSPQRESKFATSDSCSLRPRKYDLPDYVNRNSNPGKASIDTKDDCITMVQPFRATGGTKDDLPDERSHNRQTDDTTDDPEGKHTPDNETGKTSSNMVNEDGESIAPSKYICPPPEQIRAATGDKSRFHQTDIPFSESRKYDQNDSNCPHEQPDPVNDERKAKFPNKVTKSLDADSTDDVATKDVNVLSFWERKKMFEIGNNHQNQFAVFDKTNRLSKQLHAPQLKVYEGVSVRNATKNSPSTPQEANHQSSLMVQPPMTTYLQSTGKLQPSQKSVWDRKNSFGISDTQRSHILSIAQKATLIAQPSSCSFESKRIVNVLTNDQCLEPFQLDCVPEDHAIITAAPDPLRRTSVAEADERKSLSIQDRKRLFETKALSMQDRKRISATTEATPTESNSKSTEILLSKKIYTAELSYEGFVEEETGKIRNFYRATTNSHIMLQSEIREMAVPTRVRPYSNQSLGQQQTRYPESKKSKSKEMISIPCSDRLKLFDSSGGKPRPSFFHRSLSQKRLPHDLVKNSERQIIPQSHKSDTWNSFHETSTIYSSTSQDENDDHPKFVTIDDNFVMKDDDTIACLSAYETRSVVCRPLDEAPYYATKISSEETSSGDQPGMSDLDAARESFAPTISKTGSHWGRKAWSSEFEPSRRGFFQNEFPVGETKLKNTMSVAKRNSSPPTENHIPREMNPSPHATFVSDSIISSSQEKQCRSRSFSSEHEINRSQPKRSEIRLSSTPISERRSVFEGRALSSDPSSEVEVAIHANTSKKTSYGKRQESLGSFTSRKSSLSLQDVLESRRKASLDDSFKRPTIDDNILTEPTERSFQVDDSQLDVSSNIRPSDLIRQKSEKAKRKITHPQLSLSLAHRRGFATLVKSPRSDTTKQPQSLRCF